jgi:hypothetical protein
MRIIAGVALQVVAAIPLGRLQELQLRGAETGGGPMPIDFFGLSVPA